MWDEFLATITLVKLESNCIRVVESQEQIATNSLVDTLDEQSQLEEMLEETKPTPPARTTKLHYLLSTPFRYPPLKFGSRFGSRLEPSLLYGSHKLDTAFAETAYYRFLFWKGMETPPKSGKFTSEHTVFELLYATEKGLQLQKEPFVAYEDELINPSDYRNTQALGSAMRDIDVEAFEFISARDINHSINVALFTPDALNCKNPINQEQWLCETNADHVSFYSSVTKEIYKYGYDMFLIKNTFPESAV